MRNPIVVLWFCNFIPLSICALYTVSEFSFTSFVSVHVVFLVLRFITFPKLEGLKEVLFCFVFFFKSSLSSSMVSTEGEVVFHVNSQFLVFLHCTISMDKLINKYKNTVKYIQCVYMCVSVYYMYSVYVYV